jgi:hypothetical protein
MGRLDVIISDELETEFKKEIADRFIIPKKGNLKKALIEAIQLWIDKNKKKKEKR